MKKILLLLTIFIIGILFSGISYAENSEDKKVIIKQLILKKRELEKSSSKGKTYVQALDTYFEKYTNDREKINELVSKVGAAKSKLGNSKKEQEIKLLIEYIEYKAQLTLLSIPKTKIVIENSKDVLVLGGDEIVEYVEGLTINDLQDLVEDLYDNKKNIYDETIELYESQVALGRDTRRIADFLALRSGIEQIYQDTSEYPTQENFTQLVSEYLGKVPIDSLAGYNLNDCNFGYKYEVGQISGIDNQQYRISTCFESLEYTNERALNEFDDGNDDLRYEVGIWNENTIFTETFYINNIMQWEDYTSPITTDINSYDDATRRDIFNYMVLQKYIEVNPKIYEESLAGYPRDARNSKVSSDIRTLASITEVALTDGNIERENILGEEISSRKEDIGTIHTGYLNFIELQQNGSTFTDHNGDNYLFSYIIQDNYFYYQILGYIEEDNDMKEVVIKGNYIQKNESYPPSLFIDASGKYLKNGDMIKP